MSKVMDAVADAMCEWMGEPADPDLVAYVASRVEAVPHTVTIRDLSMTDDENILTVENLDDLAYLKQYVDAAVVGQVKLALTVDGGNIKAKAGYGSWSAPIHVSPVGYGLR